jgi:hypothetical protein
LKIFDIELIKLLELQRQRIGRMATKWMMKDRVRKMSAGGGSAGEPMG